MKIVSTLIFRFVQVVVWLTLCNVAVLPVRAEGEPVRKPDEYVLERVPPLEPANALASFEVADDFCIEQVAAEPLVVDPVAMAFDERGRLFVVEMRDYSEQDKERLGRVRLLTDRDGDGHFDESQIFVEGLSWPTAIACYDGGVFIGAAPDIVYCKDTNGDGRADEQRVVFTGFERGNVQGLLNSFQWGLDQRIHGATSSAGGQIRRPGNDSPPLDLRGRDFAFDPKSLEIVATTGGGQHGMSFNRWGDRFVCANSDHLQAIVFEERYLARNPLQSATSPRRSIAADGPQAAVFRISPVEAWRVARTNLRVAGLVPGPIEGGGRPAGYFTSATGVTVYEGGLWGSDDEAWVYVADVGSNLIHRKRLVPEGVTYRGERVDEGTEFVRSRDIWFRPVQMAVGPEGALYVADMYREVIEHPDSLPPDLKRQLDLTSGRDRGRIYRIVPTGFRQPVQRILADASTQELVTALDDANSWRRATALRLLYECRDPTAAAPLREQLATSRRPEARIAALSALGSMGDLAAADVAAGLGDAHPKVRRYALRLAEPFLNASPMVLAKVLSLVDDAEPVVQFQLALALGECRSREAADALARIVLRSTSNRDIADAVLLSAGAHAGAVLGALLSGDSTRAAAPAEYVLRALVRQVVRQREDTDLRALAAALSGRATPAVAGARVAVVRELARSNAIAAGPRSAAWEELQVVQHRAAEQMVQQARAVFDEPDAPLEQRLAAVESLALDSFANAQALLERLLAPQEPASLRAAALATCGEFNTPEVARLVLAHWDQLAPAERLQATDLLLRREPWALAMLQYFREQDVPVATLAPNHVSMLDNYPSEAVRNLARGLRGQAVAADRRQVFEDYRSVLAKAGEPSRGKVLFEKNCAVCHEVKPGGNALAPNLASVVNRGTEAVLFNVLVPNGEVDPRYLEYVLVTTDGQVIAGVIAGESSTAVTVRNAENKTTTVLRADIDELRNTGKSLMPEGFEKTIDKAAMADLLTYLQQAATAEGAIP